MNLATTKNQTHTANKLYEYKYKYESTNQFVQIFQINMCDIQVYIWFNETLKSCSFAIQHSSWQDIIIWTLDNYIHTTAINIFFYIINSIGISVVLSIENLNHTNTTDNNNRQVNTQNKSVRYKYSRNTTVIQSKNENQNTHHTYGEKKRRTDSFKTAYDIKCKRERRMNAKDIRDWERNESATVKRSAELINSINNNHKVKISFVYYLYGNFNQTYVFTTYKFINTWHIHTHIQS